TAQRDDIQPRGTPGGQGFTACAQLLLELGGSRHRSAFDAIQVPSQRGVDGRRRGRRAIPAA
ncbi:hypothetical protein, partial [Serratia marcescens]|uniref:hypothetical protein n=1 Tax=Serratia marcescens TaxID=615 RepID=UPI001953DC62